ncbi:hypothetical protein [Plantibacter sp. MMLR14_011]|uniref:hypothetical protein n=1 Tax=Plantibacter sp. MMLR14_011 TaxID=1898746 RepID=UPI0011133EED|nr:hypothetical protein [Plantibacter sp. MMLR14_011]
MSDFSSGVNAAFEAQAAADRSAAAVAAQLRLIHQRAADEVRLLATAAAAELSARGVPTIPILEHHQRRLTGHRCRIVGQAWAFGNGSLRTDGTLLSDRPSTAHDAAAIGAPSEGWTDLAKSRAFTRALGRHKIMILAPVTDAVADGLATATASERGMLTIRPFTTQLNHLPIADGKLAFYPTDGSNPVTVTELFTSLVVDAATQHATSHGSAPR